VTTREIPPLVTFSPTSYKTLLECPRKWHYYAVEQLSSKFTAATLAYGRAAHKAIEFTLARHKTPPTPLQVAHAFGREFKALHVAGIFYKEGDTYAKLLRHGRRLVRIWYEKSGPGFAAATIVAVEKDLWYDLDAGLRVHARIDLAWELDGVFYLTNFKTAASWGPTNDEHLGVDVQLSIEAYLCWKVLGRRPDIITKDVLKKTKVPEALRRPTERSEADLEAVEPLLHQAAELARFYKRCDIRIPHEVPDCSWRCDYLPLCRSFEGAAAMFKTREKKRY